MMQPLICCKKSNGETVVHLGYLELSYWTELQFFSIDEERRSDELTMAGLLSTAGAAKVPNIGREKIANLNNMFSRCMLERCGWVVRELKSESEGMHLSSFLPRYPTYSESIFGVSGYSDAIMLRSSGSTNVGRAFNLFSMLDLLNARFLGSGGLWRSY